MRAPIRIVHDKFVRLIFKALLKVRKITTVEAIPHTAQHCDKNKQTDDVGTIGFQLTEMFKGWHPLYTVRENDLPRRPPSVYC